MIWMQTIPNIVIPAQAGIHNLQTLEFMDSYLRGNDLIGWRSRLISR